VFIDKIIIKIKYKFTHSSGFLPASNNPPFPVNGSEINVKTTRIMADNGA
jgi:hypothetical protein